MDRDASPDTKDVEIGVLGEGSLVNLMVGQLLKAGFSVNVPQRQRDNPVCLGARFHHSAASLVRACSIVITVMSDAPQLENVFFGEEGMARFIRTDGVMIDMSTVSPEFLQELSEQLAEREISFLDAVVINEGKGESRGVQMILVGGESSVYAKALPVLEKIADDVRHIGVNGASQFYRQAFAVRKKT